MLVLAFQLASCQTPPAISRSEVLAQAEAYRIHRWKPDTSNQKHGLDSRGVTVHTPDARYLAAAGGGGWQPGVWNTGLPYKWGGFDTPGGFDSKLRQGLAAGDLYSAAKRHALEAAVSQEAAGIDCSGLISRCWGLKRPISTREFPAFCQPLRDYAELRPGDILNTANAHVYLFAAWADSGHTHVIVYEAATHPEWRVVKKVLPLTRLRQRGFVPLRAPHVKDPQS